MRGRWRAEGKRETVRGEGEMFTACFQRIKNARMD